MDRLFHLLVIGAIAVSIIFFLTVLAIAGQGDKISSGLQYVILSLMIFTAAVPILLYNLFLTGGQLFWHLLSRYGQWIAFLDVFVPKVCAIAIVVACFVLDWKKCLILAAGAFITAFIFMVVPSAMTKGKSNLLIRHIEPIFNLVSAACLLYLFGSFLL
jgi:hypothetical protein